MKHFYQDSEDALRNKMTEHEFNFMPQAWDDMESKLNAFEAQNTASKRSEWWILSGVGIGILATVATSLGIWYNQSAPAQPQQPVATPAIAIHTPATAAASTNTLIINNPSTTATKNTTLSNTNSTQSYHKAASATRQTNRAQRRAAQRARHTQHAPLPQPLANATQANPSADDAQTLADNQLTTANEPTTNAISETLATTNANQLLDVKELDITATDHDDTRTTAAIALGTEKPQRWAATVWVGLSETVRADNPQLNSTAVLGIGARFQMKPRHFIQVGLQYKQLSDRNGFFATPFGTMDFAAMPTNDNATPPTLASFNPQPRTSVNIIELRRLDILELPIAYVHQAAPKHFISAGVKLGWIANVTAYDPSSDNLVGLEHKHTHVSWFDAGLTLGYEWKFSKNWAANVQYNLGFVNLTYPSQQKYKAYQSVIDQPNNNSGDVYLMLADKGNRATMLEVPEKLYNTDLQLALRYSF